MSFVRLDDQIATHPKVLRAGAEAAWLWVCAVAYCNRQLTDGVIPREALSTLGTFRTAPKTLADRLVAVGLFDAHADGYAVHDYLAHNPDRATVQQRMRDAADRKAKSRARGTSPGPNGHGGVTPLSQRDTTVTRASSRAHVPTPTPTPSSLRSETKDAPAPPAPSIARVTAFDVGASPTRARLPHCAWEGTRKGLSVPQQLHEELLSKMAVPDEAALCAWYAETETAWQGRAIGDTTWEFWRARFREWQGHAARHARVAGLAGGGVPAARPRAVAVEDPDYRGSRYRFHCSHQPTCTTWPECRDHDQAEVSA